MGKVTAPLLSFDASGTIAKSVTFAKWRGVNYARQRVIPANPDSVDQQATRGTFAWLNNLWRYMPAVVQESWTAYASGQPMTNRNAFIKQNLSGLIGESDLTNFVMSVAAKSGPVGGTLTITPGNDQVQLDLVAPTLPDGWTIDKMIAAAIRQQDPQTGALFTWASGEDSTSTYQVTMTGLASAQTYVVGAWFKYVRPDGTYAYGPSQQGTALTT